MALSRETWYDWTYGVEEEISCFFALTTSEWKEKQYLLFVDQ